MAKTIKKLFVLGTLVSGIFMALTACDFNLSLNSGNPSNQDSNISGNLSGEDSKPTVAALSGITVVSNKDGYERGEELDITVTANYDDGSNVKVTNYTVEGFNNSQTGTQTIKVTYEDKTTSLNVLVREPVFVGITASSNKQAYEYGEDLELTVIANYSDGSTTEVENYQVTGYNAQNPGEQTLLVSYEGKNYSLKVKVNDPILVSISLQGNKESYEYGEDLDLIVTASYSDGSNVRITDFTVEGFDCRQPGEQNVIVKYEGKTVSFNTVINNPVLTGISAATNKETYEYGEDLDIVVTASYSDDSTTNITDYEVEGFDKTKPGEQTVTIKYEGKTYTFKVTVNDPVLTGITAVSNKESYEYGDELDVTVEATYSDGSKVLVTDYQVEGFNSKEAGEQTLTFTFEGKTCTLKVGVNNKHNRFPADSFKAFLNNQGIKTTIPAPIGYYAWNDAVELEQDGSHYFYATTKDEGAVGTDSLADQYAVTLNSSNWTVEKNGNEYTAYKKDGDAQLTFSTNQGLFSLRADSYSEYPSKIVLGSMIKTRSLISNGDVIVIGHASEEFIVTGYENGLFSTSDCFANDEEISDVAKNAWRFTVNKSGNYFTLTDIYGRKLGAKGLGQLAWDEGVLEWSFLVTVKYTMIMSTNDAYGRLCFNTNDGTITTYKKTSSDDYLIYPQIFRVVETDLVYPTSFSLEGKETMGIGKTFKLNVNYVPENANAVSEIVWTSSNESVATVEKGNITGVSVGTATITATCKSKNNTLTNSFDVVVSENSGAAWTIMLYICGSNLESESGCATSDISEILKVNNQPDDVNIIMETGGTTRWKKYGIDANALSRYHVENKQLVLDEKLTKVNMGKRATFESFLNWGLEEYPADNVGVIFWNHGGALDGVCFDDSIGGSDSLTNSETATAYKNVLPNYGIDKLEFVGYDACLMQVQDIAEFNSHYFNYMVTSEETETGSGWVYDQWIDDVYNGKSTKDILKANVDSFINRNGGDQTLSYLVLSKMDDYYNKFEAMASAIKTTAKNNYSSFKSLLNNCKQFYGYSYYGLVDGYDFMNKLKANATYESYKTEIEAAQAAYSQLVGYSRHGSQAGNSNGLAVVAAVYCSYSTSETSFTNWRSIFK